MRNIIQASALVLLAAAPVFTCAQTGQALIANPLLSPAKVKEVKRQIVESAHRELAPPVSAPMPAAAPIFVPPAPSAQSGFPNGMSLPQGPSPVEKARQSLTRWQIIAIVGNTAILTPQPSPSARASAMGQMAGQQWPMQQVQPMQGMQYGAAVQPTSQAPQEEQYARRSASVSIRHGERALIEGVEVAAAISGDSVQLMLGTMRGEIVYQGAIQPAVYSPSNVVAVAAREKPSTEYANARKPDSTSLSGNGANAAGNPQQGQQQSPSPYQSAQPSGVLSPLNGY